MPNELSAMRVICLEKRWSHHARNSGYDRLADYLDARRVTRAREPLMPHGIDTEAFTAGPGDASSTLRLIFVGLHMRDFEVAHRVMDRCASEGLDVVLDVVLEALACATPVISTRTGGMPDYVDDAAGWLLPPGDAEAAFECVKALAMNRGLAHGKRAGARAKAECFSWPRVAAQVTQGYRRLMAGSSFAG